MIASEPPPRVSGASREIAPPEERAGRGHEPQEPGAPGRKAVVAKQLSGCLQRQISREPFEEPALRDLEPRDEERPDQPRRGPHERGVEEDAPEELEP